MARVRDKRDLSDLVPHPRYGRLPVPSGYPVPEAELRDRAMWFDINGIFPETVIPADTTRQNYSVLPRRYYFDQLKLCRACERRFIFFAKEQKHWFEDLGFWIDADCVRCPECRRQRRNVNRSFARYSTRIAQPELSPREFQTLLDDAVVLANEGLLKDPQRLRRLRNLAIRRGIDASSLVELEVAICELEERAKEA
jgi:hypothetical protein